MKRWLTFIFILICSICLEAQVVGLDLLGKKKKVVVPFEMEQGFIIVKVKFQNAISLRMIFDTGAENTILFDKEIPQILGIPFERKIQITGSDLDTVLSASIARGTFMQLENSDRVKRDIIALDENNLLLSQKLGIDVNGLIGGSFFPNLVVTIDYKKRKLVLSHPENFKHPGNKYSQFDITVDRNKPYLVASVLNSDNSVFKGKFLVDTGAALPFLIHSNTDTSLMLPDRVMVGNVGFGLSGALKGFIGNTKRLRFGDFEYLNIKTSFQDIFIDSLKNFNLVRNGIIGNNMLSRFKVIINYATSKMYMQAKRKYNAEFEYDKSGLTIFSIGADLNQFFIVSVVIGSPAYEAGIRPGDFIHAIGIRKAKNIGLQNITRKLGRKKGKVIKMTLLRNGEKYKTKFVLDDWFVNTDKLQLE